MSSNTGSVGNLEGVDVGVIVAYFVIVMGFGLWVRTDLFICALLEGVLLFMMT